jgi:ADP-ribosylation factor-like protein 8/Arf/Sar family protein
LVLGNKNDLAGCLKEQEVIQRLELEQLKESRTVACFSVSAKSQNRLDVMLEWLSGLEKRK